MINHITRKHKQKMQLNIPKLYRDRNKDWDRDKYRDRDRDRDGDEDR